MWALGQIQPVDVRVEGVGKVFPSRNGVVRALEGVSLTVRAREFLALVGPSGCGKTTLLRIVAGLEAADEGAVWMGERRVTAPDPRIGGHQV
jgi:ABC-type sugar transport system ATPase subunit